MASPAIHPVPRRNQKVLELFQPNPASPVTGIIQKVLLIDRLNSWLDALRDSADGRSIFDRATELLDLELRVAEADLERIPKQGPVVVTANHPFGLVEGILIGKVLQHVRPDLKFLANFLLERVPELRPHCVFVDPFGGPESKIASRRGLVDSIRFLKEGGVLVTFPAGEVAHIDLKRREIVDPSWNPSIARLARMTGAAVLPLYFKGANSSLFQVLGLIHPRVRTAMLPHEFFNKKKPIEVRIGTAVSPKRCASFDTDETLIEYLRHRTYLLQHRQPGVPPASRRIFFPGFQKAVAAPGDPAALRREIESLSPDHLMAELGDFRALLVTAAQTPLAIREIGRLRELTFRQVGEGTGKPLDLDEFDRHYLHLFLWNQAKGEIVGAYRLAPTTQIVRKHGDRGLYTQTLFAFRPGFLDRLGPAVELGRSFVRPEYQRDYQPLLLLWRGIGAFIAANPQYKTLFGPVSISNDYLPASRQLMVNYFASAPGDPMCAMVKARSPFKQKPVKGCWLAPDAEVWDIDELSTWIADMEVDQKGVPVLLRQYLKLGGKLLGFHVDAKFARAIDGLIVVDLTKTEPKLLERYLGRDGAARFRVYHAETKAG